MGDPAAPGGQLFKLAALTLAAHLAGVFVLKVTTLPGLIGMLLMGILLKNVGFVNFDSDYQHVVAYIRFVKVFIRASYTDRSIRKLRRFHFRIAFRISFA